ncbi:hypothetical protein FB107DRAFT_210543, partial [Schizophyllum commune]
STRPMYRSELRRHEASATHIANAQRIQTALSMDNALPVEPASPPQMLSSDPPDISSSSPLVPPETLAGPALPVDPRGSIYDDFFDVSTVHQSAGSSLEYMTPEALRQEAKEFGEAFWQNDDSDDFELKDSHGFGATASTSPAVSVSEAYLEEEYEGTSSDGELPDQTTVDEVLPDSRAEFYPWESKQKCVGSVLTAFPRSVFSESELSAMRWAALNCGATDVPTAEQIKNTREKIVDFCGAPARMLTGAFGNTFTVLDIATILAHEWANPLVRRHVATLSEDADGGMDRRSQAAKWRKEVDPLLGGAMVRFGGKDYYVEEPALACLSQGHTESVTVVLPLRWFTRDKKPWAEARILRVHPSQNEFLVDAREPHNLEIPVSSFVLSYPELAATHSSLGYPNPERIQGIVYAGNWTQDEIMVSDMNLQAPNPLRTTARGRQVLSLPLSFYCDDTSGNVSKKWNKHNSILFTLAGLAPEQVHLLYNIHFLATSNTAPPLEMYEAVVNMLKEIRDAGGIEAYDCELEEVVLLMPWVFDFDADNPMASEFSCHVGMSGKCMCRVCVLRGGKESDDVSKEKERIASFVAPAPARSKADIRLALNTQLEEALRGAPSNMTSLVTDTGVKDKYFQYFADQLSDACARLKELQQKKPELKGASFLINELKRIRSEMPEDIFSPVLRLEEFDPALDSPVEILHVVLLGFVKYFWRDAVSRQSDRGKEILIGRINSFDVGGLNVARGRGSTLVFYAGSLTGRDFRLVIQMAPSILPGLVPDVVYNAWLSLCRLCPLLFQHKIPNVSAYVLRLQDAIDNFLAATALWNTQWFNKPKFHVLLHAPLHIKRLGPAPLMSTEGYESFNHVIRCRSVHSPRHAPSHDIARSFSWMHAVRHLLSGGYFRDAFGGWRQAGSKVIDLVNTDETLAKFMGMEQVLQPSDAGSFRVARNCESVSRQAVQALCAPQKLTARDISSARLYTCSKAILANEDVVKPNGFVVGRWNDAVGSQTPLQAAKVTAILCDEQQRRVLGFILQPFEIGEAVTPYRYPSLTRRQNCTHSLWSSFKECLAAVSVFHNCKRNNCITTRTRPVVRERQRTRLLEWEVKHEKNPDDLVLNLAQLRSASLLQELQPPALQPALPRNVLVDRAVANRRRILAEGEAAVLLTSEPAIELAQAVGKKRARRKAGNSVARTPKQSRITPAATGSPNTPAHAIDPGIAPGLLASM